MANSVATGLKVLFTALGLAMAVALAYTFSVDGSPFQREYLQPWLVRSLFDFYVNVAILAAWIIYKESSWISATIWIILLACVGSIATCVYIVIQLFKLSQQEIEQDPIYHVLLRHPNKNNGEQTSKHVPVIAGRVMFSLLGCLVLGVLVYTVVTHWSVYLKGFTTPWAPATLVDFTVNFAAIAVWVAYKESSLVRAVLWIISMFLLGGFMICTYVVTQLSQLSSRDPLYLVLFRSGDREEGKYQRATF